MPIFSSPTFLRYRRRYKQLLILFLIGLLSHPSAAALAQTTDSKSAEQLLNTATANYVTAAGTLIQGTSNTLTVTPSDSELIDPGGNLLGCDGQPLDSYAGFSMALYEPDASGLDIGNLVSLTPTASGNGIAPNDLKRQSLCAFC